MQIPAGKGLIDDLFIHELCIKLGKTRREIGEQMSAHELTVEWPLYFAYEAEEHERQQKEQEEQNKARASSRRFGR